MTSPVDAYIDNFSGDRAARLTEVRNLIAEVLPEAREEIKWGTPACSTGTVLVTLAGFSKHFNLYFTPSTITAFRDALSEHKTGKSALSLPYGNSLPRELIAELLAFRRDEYERNSIAWM